MRSHHLSVLAGVVAGALSITTTAEAHVSISSGPATASKSQQITFGVGHGCEGLDTLRVRVEIPTGITSVRALRSDFGPPTLERDGTNVTAVVWQKPTADLLAGDDAYYDLVIRARVGDVPFTKINFRVFQTCRTAAGVETTVAWTALPGETGNPAATLVVVPARQPGWNKYVLGATTSVVAADLPTYFGDAQILWRGAAAYSPNPNTVTMIGTTAGVTALADDLRPTHEVWVRY